MTEADQVGWPNHLLPQEEDAYGHMQRLDWLQSWLDRRDKILEYGCGTGYMITLPLLARGFDVVGIDLDERSVEYGWRLLNRAGLGDERLLVADLSTHHATYDVIIASEILEHLTSATLDSTIRCITEHLKPGGLLLVTVPNGYGWFEIESSIWRRLKLESRVARTQLYRVVEGLKRRFAGTSGVYPHPSTLDSGQHVQRFTAHTLRCLMARGNLQVVDFTGTTLVAGPVSNILISGVRPLTRLNNALGHMAPCFASGFMMAGRKPI
jgi:SAM-dependent methyltransferase